MSSEELYAQEAANKRRQAIAQMLMEQGQQPIETNQVAGGYVVPVSPLSGISKVAQQLSGAYIGKKADENALQTAKARRDAEREATLNIFGQPDAKAKVAAALSNEMTPDYARKFALDDYAREQKNNEPSQTRKDMLWASGGNEQAAQQLYKDKAQNPLGMLNFDLAKDNQKLRQQELANQEAYRQQQIELEKQRIALANEELKYKTQGAQGKPIPASALKMQQESLDAIGTAAGIKKDMDAIKQQVDNGDIQLGPVSNLYNRALNYIGASTKESRNLSSLDASLEKMRNDSLRLNKGVQTEGDATRAWNELLKNINDKENVSKRLGEIQRINERAMTLHEMNIDNIRNNYGKEPLDYSGYESLPNAVGNKSINIDIKHPENLSEKDKQALQADIEKEKKLQSLRAKHYGN